MMIRINQLVFGLDAGVLGASANGMGVWTQGCSLPKCLGCTSAHTWGKAGGTQISVATLLEIARAQSDPPARLTISGGEPSDQAPAVAELADGFRDAYPDAEIVLYTGLTWPAFTAGFDELATRLDVVIAGPYARDLPATPLGGSANQEVRLLTPRAERLYAGWRDWPLHKLQVGQARAGELLAVGIPDTQRMLHAAAAIGAEKTSVDRRVTRKTGNDA